MTVRIMLVDDDELIRMGLKMILESESDFDIVGEAANGAEALAMALGLKPDVILMDIQMPVMDGIEATRRISEQNPGDDRPRILVFTTFEQDEYVSQAMDAGASGFLLKRIPANELIASVKIISQGKSLISPAISKTGRHPINLSGESSPTRPVMYGVRHEQFQHRAGRTPHLAT